MSLFGGTMRIGRILGPLFGAGLIAISGAASAFFVHLAAAIAGLVLITIFVPPRLKVTIDPDAPEPDDLPTRGEILRPLLLVGVAVLVLTLVRTNRDLLLPLLGHEFGHPEAVVSLVFAVSAVIELAFIAPAGSLMDRFGRAAVLVPCLALIGVGYLLGPIAATLPGFFAISLVCAVGNGLGAGINKTLSADMTPTRNRAGWLGLWNSFTNTGALIGPALVAVTGAVTVVTASFATGWLSLAGAAWAAWWLPRFVPGRERINRRSGPPSASA
jgi:MFS family permease